MAVAHAAVFAQCQTFAAGLQLLLAGIKRLACSKALRGLRMGLGHATVAFNIFQSVGIQLLGRLGLCLRSSGFRRCVVCVTVVMRPCRVGQQPCGGGGTNE